MNTLYKNIFDLIETKSFVSVIKAANIMLQIANVTLLRFKQVGNRLFMVIVRGDFVFIKKATDAVTVVAMSLVKVKMVSVFHRLHTDLEKRLLTGLQNDI